MNVLSHFMTHFSEQTTIHGLNIIGVPKLHILERFLWLVVVICAIVASITLSMSNLRRYYANPTVVSLQKDYRNWHNPFPAVTTCLMRKFDENKAAEYIKLQWNTNSSGEHFEYYMKFIQVVSNLSYATLHNMERYQNDKTLQNLDLVELAVKVHPELSGTLVTFDPKHKINWAMIMTELGICFSVNSKFTGLLKVRKKLEQSNISHFNERILRCNYLNGLCYARYDSDPELPLNYYVHSYLDVVHATIGPPLVVKESEELEINYRMQETGAAATLRSLSPSQRKCLFDDESLTGNIPVYSTSICYMFCRYKLALKLCGCKPHFYHFLDGKICDVNGLACLSRYSANITQPPIQLGCQCPEPCNLIIYLPQIPKFTKWEYGYFDKRITFRWGLLSPTTKFRRDILFSFEDLVVSFGGTLSLFLGMSFISLIETVFLIFENVYTYYKL